MSHDGNRSSFSLTLALKVRRTGSKTSRGALMNERGRRSLNSHNESCDWPIVDSSVELLQVWQCDSPFSLSYRFSNPWRSLVPRVEYALNLLRLCPRLLSSEVQVPQSLPSIMTKRRFSFHVWIVEAFLFDPDKLTRAIRRSCVDEQERSRCGETDSFQALRT
jgi:hypothetical protein